ncbi:MAG: class I SAM-dependent DNA methyltransferase, partial [Phycisphaerales bacterium]|nr:class I SAM-dependent DNA methyltransferase [Phycisphaerales bacterium]
AQVAIWIGYLQWMRDNGFNAPKDPILEPIDTIENRDAILAWADEDGERISVWREGAKCLGQAKWPEADFIVGNPPFLGSRKARMELGDEYVDAYQHTYSLLPEGVDLCCYWFYLAEKHLEANDSRIGLLATQSIRKGSSRRVLDLIEKASVIFDAWSDEPWVLNGASVRISIACFASNADTCILNGKTVAHIHSDLSAGLDFTQACQLSQNKSIAFQGTISSGPFDINYLQAKEWLSTPNVNGNPPIDILRPWNNATDVTKRSRGRWIIDFGVDRPESNAACYTNPFEYIQSDVRPQRDMLKDGKMKYAHSSKFPSWQLWNARPDFRDHIQTLSRYLVTPRVAKHRLFSWKSKSTLPDARLFAFAVSSDYYFGILHSATHELWTLSNCSWHGKGNDPTYNGGACFETFPLPWSPGHEPAKGDPQRPLHDAIGACAATLNEQRERWLNPPEWVEPIAARIDAEDDFADVLAVSGEEAQRLIRQSAIDAACAKDPKLKKRTLTNLYNERPTWLRLAHKALDEAVLAAYAAVDPEGDWDTAWSEVFEETGAGQPLPEGHDLIERREEVEQLILGNLLRLNQERA